MELYGLLGSARVIGKFDEFHLAERSFFSEREQKSLVGFNFPENKI